MIDNQSDLPYQPISCELHSQYELAIMHKNKLCLTWLEEGESVTKTDITPLDVQTKNKVEYLIATTTEQDKLVIRLDHISQMTVLK